MATALVHSRRFGDGQWANVTATDVPTSNGIIHVIDKVLQPTATPNDIPRTAQCTGSHDSLVAAVIEQNFLRRFRVMSVHSFCQQFNVH